MAAILDHLTAILVGTALLGVLLFVQQRNQQTAVEATVHHTAQAYAFSLMETVERDADNMRLFDAFRPWVQSSGGHTTELRFHTLGDPGLGEASPIVAVAYRLEDTFRTMTVDGQVRPVYRVARYVNDGVDSDGDGSLYDYAGGSAEGVLDFDVALVARNGTTEANGSAPENFVRLTVNLASAVAGPTHIAGDQAATATTNLTQQGGTFRPLTLTTSTAATPIPDAGAALPPPPGAL